MEGGLALVLRLWSVLKLRLKDYAEGRCSFDAVLKAASALDRALSGLAREGDEA